MVSLCLMGWYASLMPVCLGVFEGLWSFRDAGWPRSLSAVTVWIMGEGFGISLGVWLGNADDWGLGNAMCSGTVGKGVGLRVCSCGAHGNTASGLWDGNMAWLWLWLWVMSCWRGQMCCLFLQNCCSGPWSCNSGMSRPWWWWCWERKRTSWPGFSWDRDSALWQWS